MSSKNYYPEYVGEVGKKGEEHVFRINHTEDHIRLADDAIKGKSPGELIELGMTLAFSWIKSGGKDQETPAAKPIDVVKVLVEEEKPDAWECRHCKDDVTQVCDGCPDARWNALVKEKRPKKQPERDTFTKAEVNQRIEALVDMMKAVAPLEAYPAFSEFRKHFRKHFPS